ncbi:ABC transporter substrate-binding protein [uncultured Albimonas sp.]|uniref:ABC transporter substrate-binding protein n=1 Tax=uncultured Albimonas sp. TaxID=1331701 RepID=UPI0030EDC25B
MKTLSSAAAAALLACIGLACTGSARAETQGVSDDAIVIGTISDLSGPLASGGAPNVQGLRLRIDEANAAGGVHGRQIDLRVEDMKYDLTLAVRATNKLVKRDEIFAMISSVGTPTTMAAQKILDPQGVPTLFPVTAARSVVEPLSPLHFSLYVNYQNQAAGALKHFVAETGAKKVCLQAVANDYGQEVVDGFEATSEAMGLEVVFHGSHKVTETDFAGSATAIKNSGCELLVLGTTTKDTINLYSTLRKLGWDKPVVGNMVPYTAIVAEAGDGATEGLYLVSPFRAADYTDGDAFRTDFAARFEEKYGARPEPYGELGYVAGDLLVKALETAGRELTVETLTRAIESISHYDDPFGGPGYGFSAEKHAGGSGLVLVQAQSRKWVVVESNLPF